MPTYLDSFYFWIPFYCFLVLLIISHSKPELLKIGAAVVLCEFMTVLVITIIHKFLPSSFSIRIGLSFAAALFCGVYLRKGLLLLKLCLLGWSAMIIYDQVSQGVSLTKVAASMITSTLTVYVCSRYLKFA